MPAFKHILIIIFFIIGFAVYSPFVFAACSDGATRCGTTTTTCTDPWNPATCRDSCVPNSNDAGQGCWQVGSSCVTYACNDCLVGSCGQPVSVNDCSGNCHTTSGACNQNGCGATQVPVFTYCDGNRDGVLTQCGAVSCTSSSSCVPQSDVCGGSGCTSTDGACGGVCGAGRRLVVRFCDTNGDGNSLNCSYCKDDPSCVPPPTNCSENCTQSNGACGSPCAAGQRLINKSCTNNGGTRDCSFCVNDISCIPDEPPQGSYFCQSNGLCTYNPNDPSGDPNKSSCDANCMDPPPLCPNGVVDPGEECDDGNFDNNDGCRNDCTGGFGGACSALVTWGYCDGAKVPSGLGTSGCNHPVLTSYVGNVVNINWGCSDAWGGVNDGSGGLLYEGLAIYKNLGRYIDIFSDPYTSIPGHTNLNNYISLNGSGNTCSGGSGCTTYEYVGFVNNYATSYSYTDTTITGSTSYILVPNCLTQFNVQKARLKSAFDSGCRRNVNLPEPDAQAPTAVFTAGPTEVCYGATNVNYTLTAYDNRNLHSSDILITKASPVNPTGDWVFSQRFNGLSGTSASRTSSINFTNYTEAGFSGQPWALGNYYVVGVARDQEYGVQKNMCSGNPFVSYPYPIGGGNFAYDCDPGGADSLLVRVKECAPPTAPGAPVVSPNACANGDITISWGASTDPLPSSGLYRYHIRIDNLTNNWLGSDRFDCNTKHPEDYCLSVNANVTSYNFRSFLFNYPFTNPGTYDVWVYAEDAEGNISSSSTTTRFTVKTVPPVPANVAATDSSVGRVMVTFSDATGISSVNAPDSFQIRRGGTLIQTLPKTASISYSYQDYTATCNNTPVNYTVTAVNTCGTSSASDMGSCRAGVRPTCEITAPLNNSVHPRNTIVNVSANASDSDGSIFERLWSVTGSGVIVSGGLTNAQVRTPNVYNASFNVNYTVTDNDGLSNTCSITLHTADAPDPVTFFSVSDLTLNKNGGSCTSPTYTNAVNFTYRLGNATNGNITIDTTSPTINGVQNICAQAGVTCQICNTNGTNCASVRNAVVDNSPQTLRLRVVAPRSVRPGENSYAYNLIMNYTRTSGTTGSVSQSGFVDVENCTPSCTLRPFNVADRTASAGIPVGEYGYFTPGYSFLVEHILQDYDNPINTLSGTYTTTGGTVTPTAINNGIPLIVNYTTPNVYNTRNRVRLNVSDGLATTACDMFAHTTTNNAPIINISISPNTPPLYSDKEYIVSANITDPEGHIIRDYNWTTSSGSPSVSGNQVINLPSPVNIQTTWIPTSVPIASGFDIRLRACDIHGACNTVTYTINTVEAEFDTAVVVKQDLSRIYTDESDMAALCTDTANWGAGGLPNISNDVDVVYRNTSNGNTTTFNLDSTKNAEISSLPEGYNSVFFNVSDYGAGHRVLCIYWERYDTSGNLAASGVESDVSTNFFTVARDERIIFRAVVGLDTIDAWFQAVGGNIYTGSGTNYNIPQEPNILYSPFITNIFALSDSTTYRTSLQNNETSIGNIKNGLIQSGSGLNSGDSISKPLYSASPYIANDFIESSSVDMAMLFDISNYDAIDLFNTNCIKPSDGPQCNNNNSLERINFGGDSGEVYILDRNTLPEVELRNMRASLPDTGIGILYVPGNLTIQGNFTKDSDRTFHILFVVNGNLTIEEDVEMLEASFLVKGNITVEGNGATDVPLVVHGALYSVGGGNNINLDRSTAGIPATPLPTNRHFENRRPVETFVFQPNMYFEKHPAIIKQSNVYLNALD